jgi:hypothetical protein
VIARCWMAKPRVPSADPLATQRVVNPLLPSSAESIVDGLSAMTVGRHLPCQPALTPADTFPRHAPINCSATPCVHARSRHEQVVHHPHVPAAARGADRAVIAPGLFNRDTVGLPQNEELIAARAAVPTLRVPKMSSSLFKAILGLLYAACVDGPRARQTGSMPGR